MTNRLWWRLSAFGALAGIISLIIIALLVHLGTIGLIAAIILSAVGGAALTVVGANWYGESIIDSATGLYNRRYLFRRLELELSRSRETGIPVGLAVIDVDDFRHYNNTYGHIAGDKILRAIADTIKSSVRKSDIVGRWGGEEFAVILPGADTGEALGVAERVRQTIHKMHVKIDDKIIDGITISVGVTDYNTDTKSTANLGDIVEQADQAMYEAKKMKNKVLPYTKEESSMHSMP